MTIAEADRQAIEGFLENGALAAAQDAVRQAVEADPMDAEAWLLQARVLSQAGQQPEAAVAADRALMLWPDIVPLHRVRLELARNGGDGAAARSALEELVRHAPDDPHLNGELAALMCGDGDVVPALPHLRIAAPVLLHENGTIWNYSSALALAGRYDELLSIAPLLDRLAAGETGAYTPYRFLAAARLALAFDRRTVIAAQRDLERSERWLDNQGAQDRIAEAVPADAPFSFVSLDQDLSHFLAVTGLHANLVLRPCEVLSAADAVWSRWFGVPFADADPARVARLARQGRAAMEAADLLGVADSETLRLDNQHFGFLAEIARDLPSGADRRFTGFPVMPAIHRRLPFLRPVLQNRRFLGLVGPFPDLVHRLGHFCSIDDTRTILISPDNQPARPLLDQVETELERLEVPFPGALFLVALPGPAGLAFCGRIKALGGVALDVAAVAAAWASR